ncbi:MULTISPECIES: hydroxymethylbilane synthase [Chromobacterium]|uniref:Porphobilinogen deaminase n=2 Tax=Chromobacterium TaxID=535 RepID=A0ABS3GHR3_9NEIS|nr:MULTISPECIES: hydroxymethylbilane synthase [Chromobacterium]AXT48629.1 hydroxymethylbilane synthase [Chromobacterium rhizoryzae]MBK0413025.1 hydroxymethylbilane synthase [Chromobacterium haemolyticum]MBO0414127.1 hydroxymethylbilane synthase [Chromobacterium haemolyticum]MBO0497387.1 hydroxymethylbilane synthase [Chromobacterium haemolyticum]MDH0343573.1 hydroxymethylbilane synthase [Chromobacterium haemolyticum]
MDKIVIASRESRLAMWQAEHIKARLQTLYPHLSVDILGMTTQGDQILDKTLSKIGGKGLFVKELEVALAEGRADLAVHSIKDVPMVLPEGFALAAICEREDPRDALVSARYADLSELPDGAVVGTSSLRRESQIRARYPRLVVKPLRGNVQTRLRKLDDGEFDAIILAAAGLKRLGLSERIRKELPPSESLPAAGQGALGIEIRADRADLMQLLAPLNHAATHSCVSAERALARELGGSCQVPLGAFATLNEGTLALGGFVASPDGSVMLTANASAPADYADALGRAVAKKLLDDGAGPLIEAVLADPR